MNKQELIKKYEGEFPSIGMNLSTAIKFKELWVDILELDEPQKPVVPKYVAKWFEEHKHNLDMSICYVINSGGRIASLTELSEFELWFAETLNPIFTLVSMLQFGYTVEKEKRYYVKVKGVYFNNCLIFEKKNKTWFFSSIYEMDHQRGHHTKEELEQAGFGWVFDCPGIEVKEVEEEK